MRVEIAVQDVAGARIAAQAGADRLELSPGLPLGGLTPSAGLIAGTRRAVPTLGTHVLVRPRPGDFCYSDADVETMCEDIAYAVDAGAAGIVVGALTSKGMVNRDAVAAFRRAAGEAEMTFHRAIDQVFDVVGAVGQLQDLGVTRILSSGAAAKVHDGLGRLEVMRLAATSLTVMAGGGLRLADFRSLKDIGIADVHLSAKREQAPVPGSQVSGRQAFGHQVTDPEQVLAAMELARSLS